MARRLLLVRNKGKRKVSIAVEALTRTAVY
jgi:hypothetical protein